MTVWLVWLRGSAFYIFSLLSECCLGLHWLVRDTPAGVHCPCLDVLSSHHLQHFAFDFYFFLYLFIFHRDRTFSHDSIPFPANCSYNLYHRFLIHLVSISRWCRFHLWLDHASHADGCLDFWTQHPHQRFVSGIRDPSWPSRALHMDIA